MTTIHSYSLVDARGNLLTKHSDSIEDLNLPPGVQALVETRINEAVDRLREHNTVDLARLSQDHAKKWRLLALITTCGALFFAVIAPIQIPKWIRQFVQDHMARPEMERMADDAIQSKMGCYVDTKVAPIESSVASARTNIAALVSDLDNFELGLASTNFRGYSMQTCCRPSASRANSEPTAPP